jgi:hypothetical protein
MTNSGWETAPPAPVSTASETSSRVTGTEHQAEPPADVARRAARQDAPEPVTSDQARSEEPKKKEEKKGFFRRLLNVFK